MTGARTHPTRTLKNELFADFFRFSIFEWIFHEFNVHEIRFLRHHSLPYGKISIGAVF